MHANGHCADVGLDIIGSECTSRMDIGRGARTVEETGKVRGQGKQGECERTRTGKGEGRRTGTRTGKGEARNTGTGRGTGSMASML